MRALRFWQSEFGEPRAGAANCLRGLWVFGTGFVLAGVLLVIFPQLLAWLLAGVLIFTGLGLIGLAWVGRRWLRCWVRDVDDDWLI
jgi:hypothetical protein